MNLNKLSTREFRDFINCTKHSKNRIYLHSFLEKEETDFEYIDRMLDLMNKELSENGYTKFHYLGEDYILFIEPKKLSKGRVNIFKDKGNFIIPIKHTRFYDFSNLKKLVDKIDGEDVKAARNKLKIKLSEFEYKDKSIKCVINKPILLKDIKSILIFFEENTK